MERNVLNRAADYNKKRRKKVRRYKMFTVLAAVVVFCTTYSLIMPAITMETPQCGLEEHTHGSNCYESTLVCTQEESGHTHGDGCYTVTTTRELTCSQEEGGGHTHGSGCYSTETEEVEKTGTRTETVQTGSQTVVDEVDEEGNVVSSHEEPIYEEQEVEYTYTETVEREVLTCTESEGGGHTHDDSCYTETEHRELTCTEAETGHTHGEDCYEKTQICELEEHTHDASCYPEDGEGEDVPPVDGEEGEDVPPIDGEEGEDVPPIDGEEGEDVPPVDGGEGEETPPAETMKPVRVDEEGYILDENGERVLDENGEPIKAEAVAPVEKPEELPEEVTPPENIGAVRVDEEGYLLDENGERVLDENGQPMLVEIPDVEVPKTLMMTVLPAGAEVPENYTETYNYVDSEGEYAVTVFAPEGAVPAGAELSATVMWGVSVEAEDGGVVPMDIHFELDGEEIEPVLPVYVVINVENLIPDDADPESVEIQHYKGTDYNAADAVQISALAAGIHLDSGIMALDLDEESAVMDEAPEMELPEDVEVVANSKAGTGDIDVNSDTLKAAFEVGEFSYFTITYRVNGNRASLKVHVVDENGKELEIGSLNSISGSNATWAIDEIKNKVGVEDSYTNNGTTYTYRDARADSANGPEVSEITCKPSYWGAYKWYYNSWSPLTDLYLVFEKGETTPQLQNVYFYVLKPESNLTLEYNTDIPGENKNWLYMGQNRNIMMSAEDALKGNEHFFRPWNSDGEFKGIEPDISAYPEINGCKYAPNGGKGTYHIEWVRYTASEGYWTCENIGGNNESAGFATGAGKCWHIDGVIVKNKEQYVVNYELVNIDNPSEVVVSRDQFGVRNMVEEGNSLDSIQDFSVPDYYNKIPSEWENVAEYDDQVWYIDRECTEVYNFSTPVGDNMTLYAPVKKIPTTFTLDLQKVVGKTNDNGEVIIEESDVPLGDATFLLENADKSYSQNKTTANAGSTDGTSHGHAIFTDLKAGTYTLTEQTAPAGYNLLAEPIRFKIAENGAITFEGGNNSYAKALEAEGTTLKIKVANVGGYVLPSTGGEGIFWYTWSGAMLMMAAAFTLMYKKSYRREGLED